MAGRKPDYRLVYVEENKGRKTYFRIGAGWKNQSDDKAESVGIEVNIGLPRPLLGVLLGGWLTNRNQRRDWVADNMKQEYRELLTTLSKTFTLYAELTPRFYSTREQR
jgi:hypothetical protein